MTQLYVIKNRFNKIVGKPSNDFDALWDKANMYDDVKQKGSPYTVVKFDGKVVGDEPDNDFPMDESLIEKPKFRNNAKERTYYIDDEEQKRDDFYDEIVLAEPTDKQMIELENNPKGITI